MGESVFWSKELSRYLLVWLSFLGATVVYCRKAHPGMDLFTSKIPRGLRRHLRSPGVPVRILCLDRQEAMKKIRTR
ncbi:MAG: TRAP transporter small permease subunit [Pseudomonadota bacterium]